MRDPLAYDPPPYTEAATIIPPSPAWRLSAAWHVSEYRYVDSDTDSLNLLLAHARQGVLFGGSTTARLCNRKALLHDLVAESTSWKRLLRMPTPKRKKCGLRHPTTRDPCVLNAGHSGWHMTQPYLDEMAAKKAAA